MNRAKLRLATRYSMSTEARRISCLRVTFDTGIAFDKRSDRVHSILLLKLEVNCCEYNSSLPGGMSTTRGWNGGIKFCWWVENYTEGASATCGAGCRRKFGPVRTTTAPAAKRFATTNSHNICSRYISVKSGYKMATTVLSMEWNKMAINTLPLVCW